jgi:hypothetical protein
MHGGLDLLDEAVVKRQQQGDVGGGLGLDPADLRGDRSGCCSCGVGCMRRRGLSSVQRADASRQALMIPPHSDKGGQSSGDRLMLGAMRKIC